MPNNINKLLKKSSKSKSIIQDTIFFLMYKMKIISKYTAGVMSMDRCYYKLEKKYKKYLDRITINDIESNKSKYVWICWFQGIENAPDIVKKCYESIVKQFGKEKDIVVITDENYNKFVDIPEYIIEKYKKGIITPTHFSDILRLALLVKYGGLWLDATVYCTGNKEIKNWEDTDLFVYRNGWMDMENINMGSWLMYSKSNNKILDATLQLIYIYWKNKNYMINYFLLHMFFKMVTDKYENEWKKVPYFSQMDNHLLSNYLEDDEENNNIYNDIVSKTDFHKLTYKIKYNVDKTKNIL